jgi:hypothetical protein
LALTQTLLQSFLSTAFGINLSFVVPKQGNWYNPQAEAADNSKPDTWCAYRVVNNKSYTLPFDDSYANPGENTKVVLSIASIEIQLVGLYAEQAVQSMAFWLSRTTIGNFLSTNFWALIPSDLGKYHVSSFSQDGINNVLAYNSTFRIQWANELVTLDSVLTSATLPTGVVSIFPDYIQIIN